LEGVDKYGDMHFGSTIRIGKELAPV